MTNNVVLTSNLPFPQENAGVPVSNISPRENVLCLFATLLGSASVNGPDGAPPTSPLLNKFISLESDEVVCSFPALDLLTSRPMSNIMQNNGTARNEVRQNIKEVAAHNLGKTTQTTHVTIQMTPSIILRNFVSSFSYLIDSRIRSWTLELLKHSLTTGDDESRARVLSILSMSSSISLGAIVTSFTALPVDDNWRQYANDRDSEHREASIPVEFQAVVDVSVQNRLATVKIKTRGSIHGSFAPPSYCKLLDMIIIRLDTQDLLKSMMDEAGQVVLNMVTRVMAIARNSSKQATMIARIDNIVRANASMSDVARPGSPNPQEISAPSLRRRVSFANAPEKRTASASVSSFLHLKKKRKLKAPSVLSKAKRSSSDDVPHLTRQNASFSEFGSSLSAANYLRSSPSKSKKKYSINETTSVDGLLLLASVGSLCDDEQG